MDSHEKYVFVLCFIVFTALVATFAALIVLLFKSSSKLITYGVNDEQLKSEYNAKHSKTKKVNAMSVVNIIVTILIWLMVAGLLITTIIVSAQEGNVVGNIPVAKVVESGSMSYKLEDNFYLEEYELNDQFNENDIVFLEKLPNDEDIKQFDVVLYENSKDGALILHRVVGIAEADPMMPEAKRKYMMQGDAVLFPDEEIITYDQMKGIYRGKRIKEAGSFILFMKSPAGIICLILVVLVTVVVPFVDKKLDKIKNNRLKKIGYFDSEEDATTVG